MLRLWLRTGIRHALLHHGDLGLGNYVVDLHLCPGVSAPHVRVPFPLNGLLNSNYALAGRFCRTSADLIMKVGTGVAAMLELLQDLLFGVVADRHVSRVPIDPPRQEVGVVVAFEYELHIDMRVQLLKRF